MNKLKNIPKFANEDEEHAFWETADTADYFDYAKAETVVYPNLKPTTQNISIRLPKHLIVRIKQLANKRDVPYQSLLKSFLAEKVEQELHSGK